MSEHKILSKNNNSTIIISFGGLAKQFGGIQPFEFLNFLDLHFNETDKYFYIDKKCNRYHKGIEGISNNIDETVEYLKNIIAPYKYITFIGVSAGGYGAILFGSLLNVTNVIAFIPPTQCNMNNDVRKFEKKYMDLFPLINNTTKYYLFGDTSVKNINDSHHISHIIRLKNFDNVIIKEFEKLNVKELRNNGELFNIFNQIFINMKK